MEPAPVSHIEIRNDKAIISRRNLKAAIVAAMVVKTGATIDETMAYYELTRSEVHAALAYYYDHEEIIEQSFREAEQYVTANGISADDLMIS
jgi:uncharacterized protein (DUF433 family)